MVLGWFHRKERIVGAARACTLAAVVLAVWMRHGVLLSGCAIYPVRQTCLSVLPWAVSPRDVDDQAIGIRSWARRPGEWDRDFVLRDWSWLSPWVSAARKNRSLQLFLASAALGVLTAAFGAGIRRQPRDDLALIVACLAACLGFWFWSAPDVRFGAGFIFASTLFGPSLAGAAWLHQRSFYSYAPLVLTLLMALSALRGLTRLRADSFFYAIPEAAVYQLPTTQGSRLLWVP